MSSSTHSLSAHAYHIPPAYSFAKSRKEKELLKNPGPGDYSPIKRYWSPAFSISKSRRQLSDYRNISPGPGCYNYSIKDSRYKYSISKALNRSNAMSPLVVFI